MTTPNWVYGITWEAAVSSKTIVWIIISRCEYMNNLWFVWKHNQIEMEDTAIGRLIREEKRNLLMAASHMNHDEQAEVWLKFQQRNEENNSTEMDSADASVYV